MNLRTHFRAMAPVLMTLFSAPVLAAPQPAVLATSNAGAVTSQELHNYLQRHTDSDYVTTSGDYLSSDGLKLAVRDIVVERALAEEARRLNIDEQPTISIQLKTLSRSILLDVADQGVKSQFPVRESEVEESYQSNISAFRIPEQARIHLYTFPILSPDEERGASEKVQQLRRALTSSDSAGDLQKLGDVTSGPVTIKRGDLPPAVEETLFSAKAGEFTQPFRRPNAWYLAAILEHQSTQTVPLEEVRDQIRQNILNSRQVARQREIEQQLRTQFPVRLHEDRLSVPEGASDEVIAEVAGEGITYREAETEIRATGTPSVGQLKEAVETIANRIRVAHWAREQGYDKRPDFQIALRQESNKILTNAYLFSQDVATTVSDIQLRALYNENPDRFAIPKQWTVRELFLPKARLTSASSGPEAARENMKRERVMDAVHKAIVSGGDPEAVAERFAEETSTPITLHDRGTYRQGPRGHVLDLAVEQLEPGDISSLKTSKAGYHLFLLDAVHPERVRSFEEAKPDVLEASKQVQLGELRDRIVSRAAIVTAPVYDEKALAGFRSTGDGQ